jgi:hypothetical protein
MSKAKKPVQLIANVPMDKAGITGLLMSNDAALHRAVVAIYRRQTASEQASLQTKEDNGVGFSGCDAEILSSFAQKILKGWIMTPKCVAIARKKMPKYWKQLAEVAMEKQHRLALRQKQQADQDAAILAKAAELENACE